jgi:hypothetical protein
MASQDTMPSENGDINSFYDLEIWRTIKREWPDFEGFQFAIATDGFNPSSHIGSVYTMWPVIVIVYNLPPEYATKKEFMFLTLLIPGKYQVQDMDIYMVPLYEELQILWSPEVIA